MKDAYLEVDNELMLFYSLEQTGGKGRTTLDLSTHSLSPKTCAVLGKVLATDRNFTEVKFADCMLSDDGELLLLNDKCCSE